MFTLGLFVDGLYSLGLFFRSGGASPSLRALRVRDVSGPRYHVVDACGPRYVVRDACGPRYQVKEVSHG